MYSHPRFLRQIIHLDLVGEVRMHNGKNITHCCTEENEERRVSRQRMQGQSGEVYGGGPPACSSGRKVPGIWEEAASGSRHLGLQLRVVAGRCYSIEPTIRSLGFSCV